MSSFESKGGYQRVETSDTDKDTSVTAGNSFSTYVARYYVLIVFCLLAAQQNTTWMTFGTIPNESYDAFGLSDDAVTVLAAYGPIAFIPLTFPFMWFAEKAGFRITIVGSAWIMAIGCGVRCFVPSSTPGESNLWIILFHIGQFLNGVVGLAVMIAPPRLSSLWFPASQRTFATAAMMAAETIGVALAFISIPYLTRTYSIHTMLYVETEISVFVAILATIYFPNHPATAPSQTAASGRMSFRDSIGQLMTNPSFLMLAISGGLLQGAVGGFSSLLSIILSDGYNNKVNVSSVGEFFRSTSWLGAIGSFASFAGGQFIGLIGYKLQHKFKLALFVLLSMTIVLGVWFAVSVFGYLHWTTSPYNIFFTVCLLYFFSFGATPIFYEACAEVTYPVPEGSSGGILAVLINIGSLLFQIVGLCHIFSNEHPARGKAMVWVLAAIALVSIFPIFFYKEDHRRLKIDDNTDEGQYSKENDDSTNEHSNEYLTNQGQIQITSDELKI